MRFFLFVSFNVHDKIHHFTTGHISIVELLDMKTFLTSCHNFVHVFGENSSLKSTRDQSHHNKIQTK